jgi:hypothetical protein
MIWHGRRLLPVSAVLFFFCCVLTADRGRGPIHSYKYAHYWSVCVCVCVCGKKRQPCVVAYKCTQAANTHVVEESMYS